MFPELLNTKSLTHTVLSRFRAKMRSSLLLLVCSVTLAAAQEPASAPTEEEPAAPVPLGSVGPLLGASAAASSATSTADCPAEAISFELVTGYVYSAPADLIDSQTGTLLLTECIDMCRQNSSCQAFNYETGLCVLIDSNADGQEGGRWTAI